MSPAKARKAIEDWVSKRAAQITLKAQEDMDEIAQRAKGNLSAEIDGLKAQAEAFDSALPFNLIDIITGGGCVKAEVITVPYPQANFDVTIDHESKFLEQGRGIKLSKGRYKVVLIVEKLEEEP